MCTNSATEEDLNLPIFHGIQVPQSYNEECETVASKIVSM